MRHLSLFLGVVLLTLFALTMLNPPWPPITDNDREAWQIYKEEQRKEAEIFRLFANIDELAIARYEHPSDVSQPGKRLEELFSQSIDWARSQDLSNPDNKRLAEIDFRLWSAARSAMEACSDLHRTVYCGGDEDCIRLYSSRAVGMIRRARLDYYRTLFLMEDTAKFYDTFSFIPIFDLEHGEE